MTPFWMPFGLKPRKDEGEGPRFADLYERGLAAALDVTLLFLLFSDLFSYLSHRILQHTDRGLLAQASEAKNNLEALAIVWHSGLPQLWFFNCMVQVVLMGIVYVGVQITYHTTPGKWLFGLSIRDAQTLEQPPGWRYILRYLGYIPGGFLFFVVSFNKRHRGVQDYIAGTVVILTRPRGWYYDQIKRGVKWVYAKLRPPVK